MKKIDKLAWDDFMVGMIGRTLIYIKIQGYFYKKLTGTKYRLGWEYYPI